MREKGNVAGQGGALPLAFQYCYRMCTDDRNLSPPSSTDILEKSLNPGLCEISTLHKMFAPPLSYRSYKCDTKSNLPTPSPPLSLFFGPFNPLETRCEWEGSFRTPPSLLPSPPPPPPFLSKPKGSYMEGIQDKTRL